MKKVAIFALAAILAFGLCACKMGADEPTTGTTPATEPTPTGTTEPTVIEPTVTEPIIDPTLDTNVPDPSVDDEHLMDPTEDGSEVPGMNP